MDGPRRGSVRSLSWAANPGDTTRTPPRSIVISLSKNWSAFLNSTPFSNSEVSDEKLAKELLAGVATGELCAAFALTEPGAGSSLNEVALSARRHGYGWSLNGHKTFISNAGIADFYTVLARNADEPKAFTMFCVRATE